MLRCFSVPRGVAVMAGGTVEPTATSVTRVAEGGSETNRICSNRFLKREFKTVPDEPTVTICDQNRFRYAEDTQLRMPGRPDLLHHTDENTLLCVST